jgi:hypothetical protein
MQFVFVDDKSLQEVLHQEIDDSQIPDTLGGKLAPVSLKNNARINLD